LRRAVIRLSEDTLSEEFLSEKIKEGDTAVADVNDEGKVYEERYGLPNQNSNSAVSAPVVTPAEPSSASSFVAGDGPWRAGPPSKDSTFQSSPGACTPQIAAVSREQGSTSPSPEGVKSGVDGALVRAGAGEPSSLKHLHRWLRRHHHLILVTRLPHRISRCPHQHLLKERVF